MQVFRTFIALVQSVLPLIGFAFFSLVILSELNSPYNYFFAIFTFGLGLFISRFVFNISRRRSLLSTMSSNQASPDLDTLLPTVGDGILKLSAKELQIMFETDQFNIVKEMTISIWGDWDGRKLNHKHELEHILFNEENDVLTFCFKDGCLLKVKAPENIFLASSYLKVLNAKEILWQTPSNNQMPNRYSYLKTKSGIKTKSNTQWKPHKFDMGLGMNALYMQG